MEPANKVIGAVGDNIPLPPDNRALPASYECEFYGFMACLAI